MALSYGAEIFQHHRQHLLKLPESFTHTMLRSILNFKDLLGECMASYRCLHRIQNE